MLRIRDFSLAPPTGPAKTALLIAALVLGQLGLLVHSSLHTYQQDRAACQLCVHAHASATGPADTPAPLLALAHELPLRPLLSAPGLAPPVFYGARAPPA